MRTIDELLAEVAGAAGAGARAPRAIAGCARNRVFAAGEYAACARASRRTRSS